MRGPSKAMTNYVVDVVIAAAFLVSAVTGVVFLLPAGWVDTTGTGGPSLAWVSLALWRTLHEWSSLIMIGGVVLHTVLHWRWVVAMTKKTFAPPRTASSPARRAPRPAAGSAPAARPAAVSPAAVPSRPADAPKVVVYGRGHAPRRTRREVLVGLGMVGAAVVTGGLAGRALADQVLERSASAEGAGGGSAGSAGESVDSSEGGAVGDDAGAAAGSTMDGSASAGSSSSSGTLVSDRVVIDEGRCNGCGHCLSSCPYGVFAFGGSVAVVADANACRLCGRCLQACPTTAITLNA